MSFAVWHRRGGDQPEVSRKTPAVAAGASPCIAATPRRGASSLRCLGFLHFGAPRRAGFLTS
jgi:hypothetical protein